MRFTGSATEAQEQVMGGLCVQKRSPGDKIVALGGNPNVGKSTVFNSLTGLNQHTGNWPGKTVTNAQGRYRYNDREFILVDVPGTYSLLAGSADEEAARDFICFGDPDVTLIVADATCLERNLNLVLQVLEVTPKAVLCINLMDEAKKKRIHIDLRRLSALLGIPVVGTSARSGKGLDAMMAAVYRVSDGDWALKPTLISYDDVIEEAISLLEPAVAGAQSDGLCNRWVALRLLEGDESLLAAMTRYLGTDLTKDEGVAPRLADALGLLADAGIDKESFKDRVVTGIVGVCEALYRQVVTLESREYRQRDRQIDRFLTSRVTGIPVMLLLLFGIFWLTITGANVPSALLSKALFSLIEPLETFFASIGAAGWLTALLVHGAYKTLAWVISVMLPPMAIFFPLFTLLEDLGYLPRVAFNLDNYFQKACAHGKQSLTMCMGFGCNACGVIGCRIIDSPRERLIAILTNNFVPCNGRFPALMKGKLISPGHKESSGPQKAGRSLGFTFTHFFPFQTTHQRAKSFFLIQPNALVGFRPGAWG